MRNRIIAPFALLALVVSGMVGAGGAADAGSAPDPGPSGGLHASYHALRSCAKTPAPGHVTCFARHLVPRADAGAENLTSVPSGRSPADIQSAYRLTGLSAGGRTVAIVDAHGYPNADRDLRVYRSQFGLSPCTTASGCLRIINQNGGTDLPPGDLGWAQEQALDLDAVSAACPSCKIVLVQSRTASFASLGTAVSTAARQPGVVAISNSYGGNDAPDSTFGGYYNHPGVALTASTGDNGYKGPSYPASSRYVTAVGGTSLNHAANRRGWKETVWSGAGSGCTTLNGRPTGQTTTMTGCGGRAMADVAADANPYTGLAVYAPTTLRASDWAQYGGTSLSAPVVAAVFALSGNTTGYANSIPYASSGGLFDVRSGQNGPCASWCSAEIGWDGPTGLGTPNGVLAF